MPLNIDKDMSGLMFSNKSDNPKAPKYKGEFKIGATQYSIAAWEREGKSGTFFSLKIETPRPGSTATPPPTASGDKLPF